MAGITFLWINVLARSLWDHFSRTGSLFIHFLLAEIALKSLFLMAGITFLWINVLARSLWDHFSRTGSLFIHFLLAEIAPKSLF